MAQGTYRPPEHRTIFHWRNAQGEEFEHEVNVDPEVASTEVEKVRAANGLALIPTRDGPVLMVWVGSLTGLSATG